MTPITVTQATTIVTTALAEGKTRGFRPLCCIVLDAGGHLLALLRDDKASFNRVEMARAKASSCIGMGVGGRDMTRRAKELPGFFSTLATVLPHGVLASPGGVLVRDAAGELIGAVGISGDSGENDEVCALAGILAAGLVADAGA